MKLKPMNLEKAQEQFIRAWDRCQTANENALKNNTAKNLWELDCARDGLLSAAYGLGGWMKKKENQVRNKQ